MALIVELTMLLGLLFMVLGCISVFKPIAALGMPTRGRAVLGIFLGFVVYAIGVRVLLGGDVSSADETAIPELAGTSPTPQLTQVVPPAPPAPPAQSVVADAGAETTIGRWCDRMVPSTAQFNRTMSIVVQDDSSVVLEWYARDGSSSVDELQEMGGGVYEIVRSNYGERYRIVPSSGDLQMLDDEGCLTSAPLGRIEVIA